MVLFTGGYILNENISHLNENTLLLILPFLAFSDISKFVLLKFQTLRREHFQQLGTMRNLNAVLRLVFLEHLLLKTKPFPLLVEASCPTLPASTLS